MRVGYTKKALGLFDTQPFIHNHCNTMLAGLCHPIRDLRKFKIHPLVIISLVIVSDRAPPNYGAANV